MATAAKVALPPKPKKEAPRRSGRTERGTTIFFNNDDASNSIEALRYQRLRLLGIIGERAHLLAEIAWDAGNG